MSDFYLITGANGMMGTAICSYLNKVNQRYATICNKDLLDIGKIRKILTTLCQKYRLVVIHCAANTNVEFCEQNPRVAFEDNVIKTQNLVSLIADYTYKFIFVSSTGVYGNHLDRAYHEMDIVSPTTEHHKSKFLAEQAVIRSLKNFAIVRVGWLFAPCKHPSNFILKIHNQSQRSNGEMKSDIDQYGSPTSVSTVVECMGAIVKKDLIGVYNVTNTGSCSRFEYVREILRSLNICNITLLRAKHLEFNRVAKVSLNEAADNSKILEATNLNILTWSDQVRKDVSELIATI